MPLYLGTAGWSIPAGARGDFPSDGSHLERYAAVLNAVEINSSFYRPHRRSTYARWADSVPAGFRFSIKVPRAITHEQALQQSDELLLRFLDETLGLGEKRGPLLVQLPPRLRFDQAVAGQFFQLMRQHFGGPIVCEPRHGSWFAPPAEQLLRAHQVGRVAADPARVPDAGQPGGDPTTVYYRLHGSPRVYYSAYSSEGLDELAARFRWQSNATRESWCIFDNTAEGAATLNALALKQLLNRWSG